MRRTCRRQAEAERAATQFHGGHGAGPARRKRLLMARAWDRFGPPSVRDGHLRRYGQRLDFFKVRAYLWHLGGFNVDKARRWAEPRAQRTSKAFIDGFSRRMRPWAGCYRTWAGE